MSTPFWGRWFASPTGPGNLYQEHLGKGEWALYRAKGNATTALDNWGGAALTATGTATARNVAVTRYATTRRRLGYVSSASGGSAAAVEHTVLQYARGSTTKTGGFRLSFQAMVSDAATVATPFMFWGLVANASTLTVTTDPNTYTDCIGLAVSGTSTNLQLIYNDAAGACTQIDLGSNFPAATLAVDYYWVSIDCDPAYTDGIQSSDIRVTVYRANADIDNAVPSTFFYQVTLKESDGNLPTIGTYMGLHLWRSNNATALAVGLDIGSITIGVQ